MLNIAKEKKNNKFWSFVTILYAEWVWQENLREKKDGEIKDPIL